MIPKKTNMKKKKKKKKMKKMQGKKTSFIQE